MPIVRIDMLAGRSAETKQAVAAEITATLARLCGTEAAHIYVMFNDVQHHDWAVAGQLFPSPPSSLAAADRSKP